MFNKSLIAHFFTTVDFTRFIKTLGFFINPYFWFHLQEGKYISQFENNLLDYLNLDSSKIISFYNARAAIYHSLKLIGIGDKDEVIIQGYTCVSVSNAVIQTGALPVYVDIDSSYNFDVSVIEKSITSKTKVLILQHTFGNPAAIKQIRDICSEYNIILIEDCAHSLGSELSGTKIGSFGDFSIFSSGRDKVISSVTGGFLVINNPEFFNKIDEVKKSLHHISGVNIVKNLNYNIYGYLAYKFYDILGLGKVIIFLAMKFKLLTQILTAQEKQCQFKELHYKLPNALAYLGIVELKKLDSYNIHRNKLAEIYKKELKKIKGVTFQEVLPNTYHNYFGLGVYCTHSEKLQSYLRKKKIYLGNYWNGEVITPKGTNLSAAGYETGSCPNAEKLSEGVLTFPNHSGITVMDVERIVMAIKSFYLYEDK